MAATDTALNASLPPGSLLAGALLGAVAVLFVGAIWLAALRARRQLLAEQHHITTQLLQTTDQGYWFIDNEGVGTDANPAMCALLGRPREQIVGHRVFEFFDGPDLQVMKHEIAARRLGKTGSYEIGITRPGGTRLHCVNHATPIYDTGGSKIGSVGIWTDITVRRQAEQARRTYELVANSMTDLVSVIGEDDHYRMVNDAWCRATGVPREQALGRHALQALPAANVAERRQARDACIEQGRPTTARTWVDLPGLGSRLLETTYYPYAADPEQPVQAASAGCVVLVTRDVTDKQAGQDALQASTEYLRHTLNATGDAIFATDATGPDEPVRFVNDQMLRMWGIAPAKGATLTPADIMAHAVPLFVDPLRETQIIAGVVAANLPHESRVHLRDGRVLRRRCEPARVGGRALRVWSFRDVTAEERALEVVRASEAEQRALLDAFPGHIGRLDTSLTYTYVNRSLAALMGLTPQEMAGRSVRELLGAAREAELRPLADRALAGEIVTYEHRHPGPGGEPGVDVQVTLAAGVDPRSGAAVIYGFAIDISARKRAEEALISARDEALRANRAKSQFLSQMSHELRTPMNAVLGFGQLLESDPRHPLAAHQQRWVQEMLRGARHLLNLINEILDLGRIEAGQLHLEPGPVALGELADDCLELVRALAQSRGVQLCPPASTLQGARVVADRTRLKQVLLNLLGNAIKYNRPGGEVALACQPEADTVWLAVRDSGHGLTAAERERLFQPFERLSAAQSGIEGTGIGLALSRRLVEAMGGTIGVESEPGVGSTFWLRLPRATGVPAAPVPVAAGLPATDAAPTSEAASTVLYIEDNPINVALMEAMLARLPGVRLVCAAMPVEGLRLAQQERPALILLDIGLPGMDGFEVLARLRASAATRATPVIAVSANALPADIDTALAAGFTDYLTKPLRLERLLATVQKILLAGAA